MSTKAETINAAYTQLRISGLTVLPTAANLTLGLKTLEQRMAQLYSQFDLNIGYNFETTPDINSQTNVALGFQNMMELETAVCLIPPFNKQVPPELKSLASAALSGAITQSSMLQMRMITPPRRMPIGAGNTFRGVFWNRFSVPVVNPPVSSETIYLWQGETQNYFSDFSAYLGSATIVSYTLDVDPLLALVASANATPRITFTINAPTSPTSTFGPWQQAKITITDSLGRVLIRLINFGIATPPVIPQP